MLQVIISPAKQMQTAQDAFEPQGIPPFPRETKRLHSALLDIERIEGAHGLQNLWGVSDRLLVSCLDVLHAFTPVTDADNLCIPDIARHASPAIMSYHGIQYQSMAPSVMRASELRWLQSHLWILSGLYGCVRPFDAVMPYRLEMGAKLVVDDKRDLYAFWGDRLARAIASSGNAATVVNLASVEYARAVLPHIDPEVTVITCIFGEELRHGKPVQRANASKKARGSMVRWMAEHAVEDIRQLPAFDIGYHYAPELSSEDTLIFLNNAASF